MDAYSIEQITAAITEARPPFLSLQDAEGNKIIPWNVKHKDGFDKAHLKRITDRLKASITSPGNYYVCFSESTGTKTSVSKLTFCKGGGNTVTTVIEKAPAPMGMSNDKIIDLLKENADLKAENATLKAEVESQKKDIESLEDEIAGLENTEEKPQGLFEGEEFKTRAFTLMDALVQRFVAPPEPATAPLEGRAVVQKTITYEEIENLVLNVPGVLEKLREAVAAREKIHSNGNG